VNADSEHACIYQSRRAIIVVSMDAVARGPWVTGTHISSHAPDVPDDVLGASLVDALNAALKNRPPVTDWKALGEPLFKAAGVRSWAALQKQNSLVAVQRERGTIRFSPCRNGGASGDDRGYKEIAEAVASIASSASPSEVGQAIRTALAQCR
jgi:hypothetical protein